MTMKQTISCVICVGLAVSIAGVFAQEEGKGESKTTLTAGVTLTDGNSETLQANGGILTEGEKEALGSYRAGVEANYGESTVDDETSTTVENAKLFGNVKKTLTEKTFAYIDATLLYDDIAAIDYRATVGPGLGVYLVKNDKTKLSVEGGVAYVWEEVADVEDDYAALRLAERLEHKLSDTARIWQSAEYLAEVGDAGNYLLNAEIGAEAALNSRLNLRLVLQDTYDPEPAKGKEKNDLTLIAGISVKL